MEDDEIPFYNENSQLKLIKYTPPSGPMTQTIGKQEEMMDLIS